MNSPVSIKNDFQCVDCNLLSMITIPSNNFSAHDLETDELLKIVVLLCIQKPMLIESTKRSWRGFINCKASPQPKATTDGLCKSREHSNCNRSYDQLLRHGRGTRESL